MILSHDSRWAATVWTIWVVRLRAWGRYPCWAARGWSSQARTCNYMLGSLNIDIDTGTLLGNEGTWGWWRPPPGGRGRSSQPPPSPPSPSCPQPPSGLQAPPRPGDNVILYHHSLKHDSHLTCHSSYRVRPFCVEMPGSRMVTNSRTCIAYIIKEKEKTRRGYNLWPRGRMRACGAACPCWACRRCSRGTCRRPHSGSSSPAHTTSTCHQHLPLYCR